MAHNKDEIKYGTAQAKLSEDEMLRVAYKHRTPLEGGKIADSERVDLFVDARRIAEPKKNGDDSGSKESTRDQGGHQNYNIPSS